MDFNIFKPSVLLFCRTSNLDEFSKIHLAVVPYTLTKNFVFVCKTPDAYDDQIAYQFLDTLSKAKSDLGRGDPEEWPGQWSEILPMFLELFNTEHKEMSKIDVNIEDTRMILDLYKNTQEKLKTRQEALLTAENNAEVLHATAADLRRDAAAVRFKEWWASMQNTKMYIFITVLVVIVVVIIVLKIVHIF